MTMLFERRTFKLYMTAFIQHVREELHNGVWDSSQKKKPTILGAIEESVGVSSGAVNIALVAGAAAAGAATAGLALAAAGTCIAAVKLGRSVFKLVKSRNGAIPETLQTDDEREAELRTYERIFEEAAYLTFIRYYYALENVVNESGINQLAGFAAERMLSVWKEGKKSGISMTSTALLEVLTEPVVKADHHFPGKYFKQPSPRGKSFFAEGFYSRPRVVFWTKDTTSSNVQVRWSCHASSNEGRRYGKMTTLPEYGYVMLSEERSREYIAGRDTGLQQMPDKAHFLLCYPVEVEDVRQYLADRRSGTRVSLNEWLSRKLGCSVIAECHDDRFSREALDLSGGDFSGVYFNGADFQNCNLDNTKWNNAWLMGTTWSGSSFGGANFQHVRAETSLWIDVNFGTFTFTQSSLQDARLQNCVLGAFLGCRLEGVQLEGVAEEEIPGWVAQYNRRIEQALERMNKIEHNVLQFTGEAKMMLTNHDQRLINQQRELDNVIRFNGLVNNVERLLSSLSQLENNGLFIVLLQEILDSDLQRFGQILFVPDYQLDDEERESLIMLYSLRHEQVFGLNHAEQLVQMNRRMPRWARQNMEAGEISQYICSLIQEIIRHEALAQPVQNPEVTAQNAEAQGIQVPEAVAIDVNGDVPGFAPEAEIIPPVQGFEQEFQQPRQHIFRRQAQKVWDTTKQWGWGWVDFVYYPLAHSRRRINETLDFAEAFFSAPGNTLYAVGSHIVQHPTETMTEMVLNGMTSAAAGALWNYCSSSAPSLPTSPPPSVDRLPEVSTPAVPVSSTSPPVAPSVTPPASEFVKLSSPAVQSAPKGFGLHTATPRGRTVIPPAASVNPPIVQSAPKGFSLHTAIPQSTTVTPPAVSVNPITSVITSPVEVVIPPPAASVMMPPVPSVAPPTVPVVVPPNVPVPAAALSVSGHTVTGVVRVMQGAPLSRLPEKVQQNQEKEKNVNENNDSFEQRLKTIITAHREEYLKAHPFMSSESDNTRHNRLHDIIERHQKQYFYGESRVSFASSVMLFKPEVPTARNSSALESKQEKPIVPTV